MNDFKVMARILAAIRTGEENGFTPSLVDEKAVGAPAQVRDMLALKLQREGYVDGLFVVDDLDNMERPVIMWSASNPSITAKGMEFVATNAPLRKAGAELKDTATDVAAKAVAATLCQMF